MRVACRNPNQDSFNHIPQSPQAFPSFGMCSALLDAIRPHWLPRGVDCQWLKLDAQGGASMRRGIIIVLVLGTLSLCVPQSGPAQGPSYQMSHWYHYPYYYFPHNYWPEMSPRWPEAPSMPYMRPPAYQAWPAFLEPNWRYEMWRPQRYYKGNHFWLDQF